MGRAFVKWCSPILRKQGATRGRHGRAAAGMAYVIRHGEHLNKKTG
jgi:hypothetical protein